MSESLEPDRGSAGRTDAPIHCRWALALGPQPAPSPEQAGPGER